MSGRLVYHYKQLRAFLGRPKIVRQTVPVVLDPETRCDNPIFIIGVHRSGTSLARRLFNSHSQIACPPESFYLRYFADLVRDEDAFLGFSGMGFERREALEQLARSAGGFYVAFMRANGKSRWADKTPQYVTIVNELKEIFGPKTRFILLYRHPFDIATSIYRRGWHFEDSGQGLFEDTISYVQNRLKIMLQFEEVNADICHSMKYEDMVVAPERHLTRTFNFLGEEFETQVLEFHTKDHNFGTEAPNVRGTKGFQLSYQNWKKLEDEQIEQMVKKLGPICESLNYEW